MNFADYYRGLSPEEKIALAKKADTSVAQLSHLACGRRKTGGLGARLRAADSNITDHMLRPDLFRK